MWVFILGDVHLSCIKQELRFYFEIQQEYHASEREKQVERGPIPFLKGTTPDKVEILTFPAESSMVFFLNLTFLPILIMWENKAWVSR